MATVLAALLAVSGSIELVLYSCGMDGQTRTSCCCPGADDAGPVVSAPDDGCCDVSVVRADILPAPESRVAPGLDAPSGSAVVPSPVLALATHKTSPRLLAPAGPRAPPAGPGPPLYIEICSWLI